ncbi:MAG: Ig-like domain-containing protein, partial [Candidatus Nanopelagicaceae bacterium]
GGSALSGCSAVASSNGEATCSWTPGSLGSVSLTAVLTPTDSANYLSETSSALSITVVTGTSAISLSLSGTPTKGATLTITATTTDIAGSVAFFLNGKRIIGCKNKTVSSGEAICLWKLSRHGEQTLSARFTPTNNAYRASNAQVKVVGLRRVSR